MDWRRTFIAVVMALALGATLAWLQGSFDKGDLKKARALLEDTHPPKPGSPSIEQALAQKLGRPPDCVAALTHSCRGIVQIRCQGAAAGDYLFDADLARRPPVLHPANPLAQALMVELFSQSGGGPTRDGGTALIPVVEADGGRR